MSGKFNGFTQEDITRLTSKSVSRPAQKNVHQSRIRKLGEAKQVKTTSNGHEEVHKSECDTTTDSTIETIRENMHFKPLETPQESSVEVPEDVQETPEEGAKPSPFRGISLREFESQRKMMEEHNKQKQDMLCKAIEQHSERTAAEAKKLKEVKQELSKLDAELASDIAILRKEIEAATIQYANTEKQYQQIEAMFLKAKMELYQASEKKELLTEHLCTIIAHKEDRKAKRLTELMEKVGLNSPESPPS
ncbi:RAB6-interacting golgin isoform X2 [Phlebotomus papatasi]|uniref:RAB6-interacting golgin isoform X2 n=1 Tax=Phlebotomus papatasi TaxID=29031 RepID=UPI0024842E79|nr:RAB6-interacting golgin isoform X2 [Phlebotomus papatasi]